MRIYSLSPYDESSPIIEAKLLKTLKPHTSPVVTTAIDCTSALLATGGADGLIKVLDIRGGYVTHTFHGHGGVISALCFFEAVTQGNENESPKPKKSQRKDGRGRDLKMMDDGTSETSSLFGFRLASGSEDGKVRVWDLHKRKSIAGLDSHVSVVRSLSFSSAENALLSASRDKTIIIWDVRTWKIRRIIPALESIEAAGFICDTALCFTGGEKGRLRMWNADGGNEVTHEQSPAGELEAIVAVQYSPGSSFIVTVHADQTLRLHSLGPLVEYKQGLSIEPMPVLRRISGNDDEVIDLAYVGPDRSMLAMATNTESIRIVSIGPPAERVEMPEHNRYFGVDVTHLDGHEDIIICMDVDWSGHWLATGAKDNNARLWRLDPETSSYICFAIFTGHAESIGAISLPRCPPPSGTSAYHDPLNYPPAFLFTGSQDRTIKRWDSGKLKGSEPRQPHSPKALYTRKAHEKDINALDVNHASTLFASASQDRTVKIWSADDGSAVGVLRGHKRGVWSVRFAPQDTPIVSVDSGTSTSRGMVVTGSGDKTIKLWSLSDYSCLLTFEGHSNSVLKVLWLPPPQLSTSEDEESQPISRHAAAVRPLIASAAADGLVKIWSPYTGELEATLDNHTDRVWALAIPTPSGSRVDTKLPPSPENAASQKTTKISSPYSLISGSADSTVTFWIDTTSATLSAAVAANSARIEQDQQLQNYIRAGAYREAITLALQLNHPGRLLSLFTAAINDADGSSFQQPTSSAPANLKDNSSLTGSPEIDTVLQSLDRENLYALLLRVRDWNTNARTAKVAQRILHSLVRSYPPSTFVELATDPSLARRENKKGSRGPGMKEVLDALTVYTDRHYRRIEELVDESYLVEWVLGEMDGGLGLIAGLSNTTGFPLAGLNGTSQDYEKDIVML